MSVTCILGFHKWDGCRCSRCEAVRDKDHKWDGDKCSRCGKPTPEEKARLLKAIEEGDYEAVETRLSTTCQLSSCKDVYGNRPLHLAAERGHASIVQLLLGCQANVDGKNRHGNTPLHLAVGADQVSVAELLISHGANVNAKNEHGDTLLHVAADKAKAPIAGLLISRHANINVANQDGNTPLDVAARNDNEGAGGLLVDRAKVAVLKSIDEDTSGGNFGLSGQWKGDRILLRALDVARASGSHKMAAHLFKAMASVHRAKAKHYRDRANMFVKLHNRIIERGDTPAGMHKGFAESNYHDAQEENRKAREADLAADSEIALSAEADKDSKTRA